MYVKSKRLTKVTMYLLLFTKHFACGRAAFIQHVLKCEESMVSFPLFAKLFNVCCVVSSTITIFSSFDFDIKLMQ